MGNLKTIAGLSRKPIHPMLIVLASITIIEIAITILYPNLRTSWERIPVLVILILVPFGVVGTFLYLWVKIPGHLYPPSEFNSESPEILSSQFRAFQCKRVLTRNIKNNDCLFFSTKAVELPKNIRAKLYEIGVNDENTQLTVMISESDAQNMIEHNE